MGTERRDPRNKLSPPGQGAKGVTPGPAPADLTSSTGQAGRKLDRTPGVRAAARRGPRAATDGGGGIPPFGPSGGIPTRKRVEPMSTTVREGDPSSQRKGVTGFPPGRDAPVNVGERPSHPRSKLRGRG